MEERVVGGRTMDCNTRKGDKEIGSKMATDVQKQKA
jgi:hypothetical protein